MPTFLYKARDATGKAVKGTMDIATKEELIAKLHQMGYMTTGVSEARPGVRMESFLDKIKPVGTDDMILFYVQLANMISSGITLLNTLSTLGEQLSNRNLREAVGSVARSVEGGESFSQALSGHPRVFPKLFVNMVKAGEISGKLDTVCLRYAQFFEHEMDLKQKVKGALFYPAILLAAGIAVTLFVVTFIVPQFVEIFMKVGLALPLPTQILYMVGMAIKNFWYAFLLIFIGFCFAVRFCLRTKRGRLGFDRMKLKVPLLGSLHRKSCISGFARTLGTLTASGVPILESLDITKGVLGNEVLGLAVESARKAVEKGEKIAEPLKISGEFPADTVQMISVGEETGNLAGMLDKIADFYDLTIGYAIKKLTTVLEPVFLLVMGSMVGFIMASMLLPIFDMMKVLRR